MGTNAKKIVVFNHKGGVGKTTLTMNIAVSLTDMGKRVLLVDADPQCNLTAYLIEGNVFDQLLDKSELPTGRTIWSALRRFEKNTNPTFDDFQLLETNGCTLVPGDLRMTGFESQLDKAWFDCQNRRMSGFDVSSRLNRLINQLSTQLDADYVFIDTGPNVGPLNRLIILDCDGYIVPVACDLFSKMAIVTLGATICEWLEAWHSILALAPDKFELPRGLPHFLGYVPQNYRIYSHGTAQVDVSFLAQIEQAVYSHIIHPIRDIDADLTVSEKAAKLPSVRDFGVLIGYSQAEGLPLWKLKDGETPVKEEAKEVFQKIAKEVLKRV